MPLPLRWILIVVAAGLCAAIIVREGNPLPGSAFLVQKTSPAMRSERARYQEEMINLKQDLPFVHVASVIELKDGALAALWYGGPFEYCHDNKIYFSEKRNGAWLNPWPIMTAERAEHDLGRRIRCLGNPLMCRNPDGSLRLLFVTIAVGKWAGSQLNTTVSKDGGLSWSPSERLTLSPLCNFSELVRNRPLPLTNGSFCVPVYQELVGKFPELLWLKEREGQLSVCKTRIAGGCATLQPSVIPLDEKRAVVLLRDWTQAKRIFVSRSADAGLTWTKPVATNLPNPDAGLSGLRLRDGRLLAAYNDSVSSRTDLSFALSEDEGLTWRKIAMVEEDPKESFSYPYLMQTSDGMIHVAYTWNADGIKMISFNDAWIKEQETKIRKP
jgi:predicted neuraminidase